MAVARMSKVTVLAHQSVMDELIDRMQHIGVLEIEPAPADLPPIRISYDDQRLRALEERRADASFVRDFLGRYHEADRPFSAFVSEKIHMDVEEYRSLVTDRIVPELYARCEEISSRIANGQRERERLLMLAGDLAPWERLRVQISRLHGSANVVLFTGTVPGSEGAAIRQALRDITPLVTVEEHESVGGRAAWVVMVHRSVFRGVRDALAITDFQDVTFPDLADYPAEERARALASASAFASEIAELEGLARSLAEANYHRAVAVVQAVESELEALTVRERFATTERTFAIHGWVRTSQETELASAIEPFSANADLTLEPPGEDDHPPVILENPWYFRPFQVLTELYGLPRYDEIDPTPLLAPFFLAFFALCIGDVGYGLMLIGGAWYIKHKIDVAPGVKRFMDLLMFGGAGAIVVGVLFGSYFALDFEVVKRAVPLLGHLQVLDPLKQLPTFLLLTIGLGVTEVLFGVLVAAWDLARRGDRASAFFDQLSTVLLFAFVAVAVAVPSWTFAAIVLGLGVTVLFKGRALEAAFGAADVAPWDRAAGGVWMITVLVWLASVAFRLPVPVGWALLGLTVIGLALSKTVRRSVVALLGGLYAVYGMTAFLGDVLSYTRLAALGLSGALVGMVFNTLASLVMGGADGLFAKGGGSVIGGVVVVVLASLVFVVGHVFNVVINLLGAFVHPARLQFVEFFSKFYEGGGRSFSPFAHQTKSLVLHAGGVRQEGAGS